VRDFYVAETMPLEKIFNVFYNALLIYKQSLQAIKAILTSCGHFSLLGTGVL
jgi:hypothetical protein